MTETEKYKLTSFCNDADTVSDRLLKLSLATGSKTDFLATGNPTTLGGPSDRACNWIACAQVERATTVEANAVMDFMVKRVSEVQE
jgi:hypothetical protein